MTPGLYAIDTMIRYELTQWQLVHITGQIRKIDLSKLVASQM